jgi:hypothetical protein
MNVNQSPESIVCVTKSNGNEARLINCASVSNMVIGSTIFEHNNKYNMS